MTCAHTSQVQLEGNAVRFVLRTRDAKGALLTWLEGLI